MLRVPQLTDLRMVLGLCLGWCVAVCASPAAYAQVHTFVLHGTDAATNPALLRLSPDPMIPLSENTILTYNAGAQVAVVASTVLVGPLNDATFIDAISFGRDIGGRNSHSYFYYGVKVDVDDRLHGLPHTAMSMEPIQECEADLWWREDMALPDRIKGHNYKGIDENNTSPVPLTRPRGITVSPSLGLEGRYGRPQSLTERNNVAAFDIHSGVLANTEAIYFSIDTPFAGYSRADILRYENGVITVLFRAQDLGLDSMTDDIDGLALNLSGEGAPVPLGWISLTPQSTSLGVEGWSAADILEFEISHGPMGQPQGNPVQLHMSAEALGIGTHLSGAFAADADIDTIAHIDPAKPACRPRIDNGDVTVECGATLDGGFSWIVNDKLMSSHQGPDTSLSYVPSPLGIDKLQIYGFRSPRPFADGYLGEGFGTLVVESGTLAPPTAGSAESNVDERSITFTWSNPTVPYDAIDVYLDDGVSEELVNADATTYTTASGLATGVHRLVVRVRQTNGLESTPLFITETLELPIDDIPLLNTPDGLAAEVLDNGTVEVTWINRNSFSAVDVAIDCTVESSPPGALVGETQTEIIAGVDPGRHVLTVTGMATVDGITRSTVPAAVFFDVPIPAPGDAGAIVDVVATPTALDIVGSDLWVADDDGALTNYTPDPSTPVSIPGLPTGTITGLANDSTTVFLMISGELVSSAVANGVASSLGEIYPNGEGTAGDIALLIGSLWVVDEANDRITNHTITGSSVSGIATSIDVPGEALGVAAFEGNLHVLHSVDSVPFISSWTADGTLLGTLELNTLPTANALAVDTSSPDSAAEYLFPVGVTVPSVVAMDPPPAAGEGNCHTMVSNAAFNAYTGDSSTPLDVTDNANATVNIDALNAATPDLVRDLDLKLHWTQEMPGAIACELTSPSATTVLLYDEPHVTPLLPGDVLEMEHHFDDLESGGFNDSFGTRSPNSSLDQFDGEIAAGDWQLSVLNPEGVVGTLQSWQLSICTEAAPLMEFVRGDINNDMSIALTDVLVLLQYLFTGGATPGCLASADVTGDQMIGLTDALYELNFLFNYGPAPLAPFPSCGFDPSPSIFSCLEECL